MHTEARVTLRGAAPMWGELVPMMKRVTAPLGAAVPSAPATDATTLTGLEQEGKCRAGVDTSTATCATSCTVIVTVTGAATGVAPPLLPEEPVKTTAALKKRGHQ